MSDDRKQDIHEWFGLTYAQFLVVPRVIMSAMPIEWQERMVELLEQMDEAYDWFPPDDGTYYVRVGKEPWPREDEDGNPNVPVLEEPPQDLCNYRHPRISHRRKGLAGEPGALNSERGAEVPL